MSRPVLNSPFRLSALLRRVVLAGVAVPLALGLSACHKDDAGAGAASGDVVAAVPAPAGKSWSDVV